MVGKMMFIGLLFLTAGELYAQVRDSTRSEVEKDLERALEDVDSDDPEFDSESLTQYLQDLAANPVNINRANTDILLSIPGMSLQTARAIITYRNEVKPFENVNELTEVDAIGTATLEKMLPYVTVGSGAELGRSLYANPRYWTHNGRLEMFSRYQQTLQQQEGYRRTPEEGGFAGSPMKYYQKTRYRSSHLSMNVTQEKDPGEPLDGKLGFNFFSGHVALQDNGKLQNLVIGDYGLSFGQGLVLWNGGSFGKGREVTGSVNKNERGILPYASAQETDFYRGVAATYGGKLKLTGFYSYRKRSASVMSGDTVRYPRSDGLHRTLNERAVFNNLGQQLYGGRIRAELPFGFVGATGYQLSFDKFINSGNAVYNRYDFSGAGMASTGIDYRFLVGSASVFGEAAASENGGYGFIAGIESPLGKDTDLVLAYRHYSRDFHSLLGSGFGEASGGAQNETGIYLGLRHSLNQIITLSGYFDQYRFPVPRFGTSQPTRGFDWLGLATVRLNRDLQFYLQVRSELKENEFADTDSYGREVRILGSDLRRSIRGHLEYWVNKHFRIRTRAEVVQSRPAGKEEETGYLLYQDLRFASAANWKMDMRVTVFETRSFNSRVYQFENDLLYVMSNQMLYGRGQRLYLLFNIKPLSFMEAWAKFGITVYEDQLTTGSGLNQIEGNRRSDLGVQVRFKF